MAAAGAKAGQAAAQQGGGVAEYLLKHLGARPPRGSRRTAVISVALALLALGGRRARLR